MCWRWDLALRVASLTGVCAGVAEGPLRHRGTSEELSGEAREAKCSGPDRPGRCRRGPIDAAGTEAAGAMVETFAQLDELLIILARAWTVMKSSISRSAPTSITITPVRVADLLAEVERMPV